MIDDHRALTRRALAHLTEANADAVAEIAGLADVIRGYEQVKLRAVERYRTAAADQLRALGADPLGQPRIDSTSAANSSPPSIPID